jgi:hypothetical protein
MLTTSVQKQDQIVSHPGGTKNLFFQPKLAINQPNDVYEQEADAMAKHVMRMTDTSLYANTFFKPSDATVQCKCAHCEEEEKKMQRKEANNNETEASPSTENYISALNGKGRSLNEEERKFFEPRMGYDFSDVKIHTDTAAARSAQSINALAYTSGNNIVFNEGQYAPATDSGKKLLGHELTHVIQQQKNISPKIQRVSYYPMVNSALGLGPSYNYSAAYVFLSPLNKDDMLDTLYELHTHNSTLIQNLITNLGSAPAGVGVGRLNAYLLSVKNALMQNRMTPSDLTTLNSLMSTLPLDQQQTIEQFTSTHRSAVSQDLYAGAHLPSSTEQGHVETILNPGSTSTVSSSGVVTITPATPDPVCSNAANLETRIRTVLVPVIHNGAAAFRTRQASAPNFPLSQANSMADLAQREVEHYFEPYLARASRSGAPGTYSLGGGVQASSLLRDQSTAYNRLWNSLQGRLGWLKYWYDHLSGNLNNTLHCDNTQLEAALTRMANDAALEPDIRDYIDSWPAEATGGINIQPYLDNSNLICQRWDSFTTIIHEFIHILAHPNFVNAENALQNSALEVLKEGLDDVLRKELWEGAGNLRTNLTSTGRAADRAIIEGGSNPLDMTKVCNHNYYDNLPAAENIVTQVGINNIKLSYFLGQTEYLGLGSGTTVSSGHSLSGTSFYTSTDANEVDLVNVNPGETGDQLLLRTNGREIRDSSNAVIPLGNPIPSRVRIPGVRHVYVHTDDSLTSIAVQNGVTPFEIMRANNLTNTTLTVGSRLIIPRH